MKNLFLLCGKPGAGKTTLANFLAQNYGFIHLSVDDFMLRLFGEIEDRNLFNEKLNACKELIYELCFKLLNNNDVVLDFGFWGKEERQLIRNKFSEYNVLTIYIKLSDDEIFNRIEKRNSNLKENEYFIDKETFNFLSSKFEEPNNEKNLIVFENIDKFKNFLEKLNKAGEI